RGESGVGFHLGFFKNISREAPMRFGAHSLVATAVLSVAFAAYSGGAAAQDALDGKVSSAEEGAMGGVLVSAKRAGSTVTHSVVSDGEGRYGFPAAKLEPAATRFASAPSATTSRPPARPRSPRSSPPRSTS